MKSVVLLSSGLDSAVAFKSAYDAAGLELAITFDYGQMAAAKEIELAEKICRRFRVRHMVMKLPWLKEITNTGLVRGDIPEPRENELDDVAKCEKTAIQVWVPNRNGLFLNIAACYADAFGYDRIVCGFNAEEGVTFPDNTHEFAKAVDKCLSYSTLKKPTVFAPVINMTKEEIIREGIRIEAPLDLSWSCYYAGESPCGKCESCMRRARAFRNARVEDPSLRGTIK